MSDPDVEPDDPRRLAQIRGEDVGVSDDIDRQTDDPESWCAAMTTKEDPTVTTKTSVATTVDTRTVAELEAAVIAGDASIAGEQLATARARQDHTPLPASAAEHRAQLAAEAARQGQIGRLRDDIESLANDRERLLTLAQQASDALRALFTAARAREDQLDALAGRAKALGINAMSLDDQVRDPSGIGWRREHALAGPARIRLGDTALSAADPHRLVAWIVKDTFDRTGQRTDPFGYSEAVSRS